MQPTCLPACRLLSGVILPKEKGHVSHDFEQSVGGVSNGLEVSSDGCFGCVPLQEEHTEGVPTLLVFDPLILETIHRPSSPSPGHVLIGRAGQLMMFESVATNWGYVPQLWLQQLYLDYACI